MNYILDTHVLLWSMFESHKLSKTAEQILLDSTCHKFISITSMWEISIKNRIGKLPLPNGISDVFDEVGRSGYGIIGIERSYIEHFTSLPLLHRDPFDGIIISTAILEQMTIVTTDVNIQKYTVPWVW